jgi:predicted nucleotidyltransferase
MGRGTALTMRDPALHRFARRLRDELGARRVILFGSHARNGAAPDSDYDLILVADRFRDVPRSKRQVGLRRLFYSVGGHAPMDLICLTPEEFEDAAQRDTLIAAVVPDAIDLLAEADSATT